MQEKDESNHQSSHEEEERDEIQEVKKMSQQDTKRVRIWRLLVFVVLLSVALAVTLTTFSVLKREEHNDFETAFDQFSRTVADAAVGHQHALRAAESRVALDIAAMAKATNQTFPFFTYPDYELIGRDAREQGRIELLSIANLVTPENYDAYIKYTGERYEQAAAESRFHNPVINASFQPVGYTPYISGADFEPDIPRERYFPLWTVSPPPVNYKLVNWNVGFVPDFGALDVAMMHLKNETLFTRVRPYVAYNKEEHKKLHTEWQDPDEFPHSFAWHPIHEEPGDTNSKIVGAISGAMAWDASMQDLLPVGVDGIHCILKSSFNQTYSYEINGPYASFIGEGDKHDPKYDHMVRVVNLSPHTHPNFLTTEGHCIYELHIYPSSVFEGSYDSNTPEIFALVISSTFLLIAVVYLVYDMFVQRRNQKLVENAARSNAIVTQMFPSQFRDRIIGQGAKNLKSFMQGKTAAGEGETFDTKPLADLFLETTILFADIVGFTAWTSSREPSQVFTLLETIYGEFDKLAKLRRVFKVETVGDCYVAATGIPEHRSNHAIMMVRFARDILTKMSIVTKQLEVSLGPDTGDLSIRIGIHSGPVTAGVLRGERARFQLFGDTMNTASRIESTGKEGQIHISQETADLIFKSGKASWIIKREDKVSAKGKGEMQTYWIQTDAVRQNPGSVSGSSGAGDDSSQGLLEGEDSLFNRNNRLIDWNVERLLDILKQIVVRREAIQAESGQQKWKPSAVNKQSIETKDFLLDEVKEIITLPEFHHAMGSNQRDPQEVKLPQGVIQQLRDYVACVASLYQDNPFHNFEHASHVVMSVTKLLSRIVAPSDFEFDENAEGHKVAATLHDHTYGITSDPMTQFACAFSALIHDVDHSGVPNIQLIKEDKALAAAYKNRSVAEQNSLVLSWDLLMDERFDDFRTTLCANDAELQHFRQLIVNGVLATDIADKDLKELRNARWDKAFKEIGEKQGECVRDIVNRKATIVIEHLIQASDIAHTMQHWHVYRKWNERFFRESYAAFKAGRAESDPTETWYKGEIGFFDFYIIPLAKKLKECGVFGKSSDEYLNYAMNNRKEWESRGREVVAEMIEAVEKEAGDGVVWEQIHI